MTGKITMPADVFARRLAVERKAERERIAAKIEARFGEHPVADMVRRMRDKRPVARAGGTPEDFAKFRASIRDGVAP